MAAQTSWADGPDGFVGDDHVLDLLLGHVLQGDLDLHADQFLGNALFALGQALAHADDGLQAGVEGGQGALVDGLVGLGKILAALAVADDHVLHAQVHQHIGGNFAGVGAGLLEVDVLGAHMDVGARALGDHVAQVGEGYATSQSAPCTPGIRASSSRPASVGVLFIFQLPAITALRFCLFIT